MKKVRVAIIDSGISEKSECACNIVESYSIGMNDEQFSIINCNTTDYIGHGSAVAHIIYKNNTNIEIVSFRICDHEMEIDEEGLIFVLEYIYEKINVDIINISAGVTYLYNYKDMDNICNKLYKKGVIIVSAFDNEGAISFPAALNNVIGIDTKNDFENKNEICHVKNSIIDILVPNIYYRTVWIDKNTIIKGSSFACANITGILSHKITEPCFKYKKNDLLDSISNSYMSMELREFQDYNSDNIKKAIVFPVNKESHSLLRFKDTLKFEILGFYDDRLSGRVGEVLFGEKIKSYDEIDWNDEFDTVILSCISKLTSLTKRQYSDEILHKAEKYGKKIYSFEQISSNSSSVYHPKITTNLIPYENNLKLHKTTIPVIGIFGTSSKQGKFTLQLNIIKHLAELGYNVGHISTEPSGYLFNSDYVFHFGYHANLQVQPWECIAILNNMIWKTQLKNKDILVTGCQSNILHYNNNVINDFGIYQYAFALGIMADFCILCVNPHDDIDYIDRTISFINSIDNGKVNAIAIFPIQAIETKTGFEYKTQQLKESDLKNISEKLFNKFDIPVISLGDGSQIERLCDLIIKFFE